MYIVLKILNNEAISSEYCILALSLEILLSITYKQNFPIIYVIMYGQKQNSGSYSPYRW